ncbi:hypothetical protein LTR84_009821 [Exophiala bonariae]|uniref:N-acetyltransferase domain-containing protein n=1 Tax=Exophiala bonariae TaxID=1690606 RepID=A0AAV9NLV2_9EURO|nr:hypothetical protein LTR84_009821 [Exophiala bonariae]
MATSLLLRVLTTQELAADKSLVPLVNMINNVYGRGLEGVEDLIDRYSGSDALLDDLGTEGLCAFMLDTSQNLRPVAVVGAKRWKGYRNRGNPYDNGGDWEIGPAASDGDPQYRKKGLVDQCLEALYTRLLAGEQAGTVRLRMTVLEDVNAPYWRRKGYEQDGERWVIPRGRWHKLFEYTVIDMVKEISVIPSPGMGT